MLRGGAGHARNVIRASIVLLLSHGVVMAQAASPCDPATNAKEVAEARKAIDQYNTVVNLIERSRLPVPEKLAKAMKVLNRFATAAEIGVNFGEAAGQADYEVQRIMADKHALCATVHEDSRDACDIRVEETKILRALDYTLNWSNPGSVIRRGISRSLGFDCDTEKDLGGVSVDVDVKGSPADLSDVRSKVLEMDTE
jgi:hypothetical protein